jgi:hypothetical protein
MRARAAPRRKCGPPPKLSDPASGRPRVEPVRAGEPARVPVARTDQQDQLAVGAHWNAADFGVRRGAPQRHLDGRLVAQRLLRERRRRNAAVPHRGEGGRIGEHDRQAVAEQVGGRHEPGQDQHVQVVKELGVAQPTVARVANLHQHADQVVAWLPAAVPGQRGEVVVELHGRRVGQRERVLRPAAFADETGDKVGRQRPERLPVRLRYADQVADHGDRQQVGEAPHEVDPLAGRTANGHVVEQAATCGLSPHTSTLKISLQPRRQSR